MSLILSKIANASVIICLLIMLTNSILAQEKNSFKLGVETGIGFNKIIENFESKPSPLKFPKSNAIEYYGIITKYTLKESRRINLLSGIRYQGKGQKDGLKIKSEYIIIPIMAEVIILEINKFDLSLRGGGGIEIFLRSKGKPSYLQGKRVTNNWRIGLGIGYKLSKNRKIEFNLLKTKSMKSYFGSTTRSYFGSVNEYFYRNSTFEIGISLIQSLEK